MRCLRPPFTQAPQHVFDPDNSVVDQLADGDGKSAQGHGVDRESHPMEHQRGNQQRDRQRGQGDEGGAHVEQEQQQHDGDDDRGIPQRLLHAADRCGDEIGLSEQDRVIQCPGGHSLPKRLEGALHLARRRPPAQGPRPA